MPIDVAAWPLPVAATLDSPVPLIVGVLLVLAGLALALRHRRAGRAAGTGPDRSGWLSAPAKIVDFELGAHDGKPSWRPVYAFAAPGLRNIHAASPHDPPVASKKGLGEARTIHYNPDDARDFTASAPNDRWITLWIAVALVSIGVASIVAWLVAPDTGATPI
ncbi:MAG: hypothetical protein Q7T55_01315 [Solirubrobacteraceae bacterium]|nr:hypothetical protein [Solirubrobacteraceae bacterium]